VAEHDGREYDSLIIVRQLLLLLLLLASVSCNTSSRVGGGCDV